MSILFLNSFSMAIYVNSEPENISTFSQLRLKFTFKCPDQL